ncbi:MAG: hypothetical protein ACOYNI_06150 [Acidimicrobiia bacterium]
MRGNEHLNPPPEIIAIARHVQDLVEAAYREEQRRIDPATHDELAVAVLVDRALARPGAHFEEIESRLDRAPVSASRAMTRLTKAFPESHPVGFGSISTAAGVLLRRDGDRVIAASHDPGGNTLVFRNGVRVDGHVFWINGTRGEVSTESGLTGGIYAALTSSDLDRNGTHNAARDQGVSI